MARPKCQVCGKSKNQMFAVETDTGYELVCWGCVHTIVTEYLAENSEESQG